MKVIGLGLGRTGTNSLRLALNQLGLGPCHHMEEVLMHQETVPLWTAAARGTPDWAKLYAGYPSAVDWPTAAFTTELIKQFPDAKYILTHRNPESWYASFSGTIYKLMNAKDKLPPPMMPWYEMGEAVLRKTGVVLGMDKAALLKRFADHMDFVKSMIPAKQLLVYDVSEGWAPLCAFLGVPVPAEAFPKTNNREEFWSHLPNID